MKRFSSYLVLEYIKGLFYKEVFCPYHRPGIPVALSLLECIAELLGPNTDVYSQVCKSIVLHRGNVCVLSSLTVSPKDVRALSIPLYGRTVWDITR